MTFTEFAASNARTSVAWIRGISEGFFMHRRSRDSTARVPAFIFVLTCRDS
jgi:hypothetical protein